MQDTSGNPALNKKALSRVMELETTKSATISGTVFKTLFLLALVIGAGAYSWNSADTASSTFMFSLFGSMFAALAFGLIASFVPKTAPITAPLYALAEGYLLGAVSFWASSAYSASGAGNIVVQAIALTGVIFFATLFLYQTRLVQVTQKFKAIVMIGMLGIFMYYMLAMVLGLFGVSVPLIYDSGPWGIAFSLVVIFIAAMSLLLDFNMVETAVTNKAPKVFEWYGAFALMVTLVWLYLEILRLLGKLRG